VTFKRNTEFRYTLFSSKLFYHYAKRVSFVNVNVIEHRLDLQRVIYRDEECDCTLIGDERTVSFKNDVGNNIVPFL